MPDEIHPEINSLETAIVALNREVAMRLSMEKMIRDLRDENQVLKGQLCQCKIDREVSDLVEP